MHAVNEKNSENGDWRVILTLSASGSFSACVGKIKNTLHQKGHREAQMGPKMVFLHFTKQNKELNEHMLNIPTDIFLW